MDLFVVDRRHYVRHAGASSAGLATLAAFNRINALSCIKSAEHGWIGSCYSTAELLTALYFGASVENVVLSKGHAAAMQYACLYGLGRLSAATLLSYKDGPTGLQAHADRATPGILINSGSLGQALSKIAGLAVCRPGARFAVVLGDGEMQEGQVYEALQTVVQRRLSQITVYVDCNGFQSELRVDAVKRIADLGRVAEGFGLQVERIDGHASEQILASWQASGPTPRFVLAETVKAGGSRHLAAERERQSWHSRVPDNELYAKIVEEQLELAGDAEVQSEWREYHRTVARRAVSRPLAPLAAHGISTRDAFAKTLTALVASHPALAVLDADLAHACGLEPLQHHARFFEMGISEQDMVSFAGGLALGGRLPVVNTYATFFKRALEQMFVNASEAAKIIYAGHYAGLCYFTDGKTHQSINDLALMRGIPGLVVIEPATPEQTAFLLDWAAGAQEASVYFRLRRTPAALTMPTQALRVDRPLVHGTDFRRCFVTAGPVSTALALECQRDPRFAGFGLIAQAVLGGPLDRAWYAERLRAAELVVTIEEDLAPGALCSWLHALLDELQLAPRVVSKTLPGFGASFRTQADCLAHFGYTPTGLAQLLGPLV